LIDPTELYLLRLPSGRGISIFFYNAPLSGGVSFDWDTTSNADLFAASYLPGHLVSSKREAGEAQLLLIATDGELYGHHKPWRDKFLTHLVRYGAPAYGFKVSTLERFLQAHPATREVTLRVPSAWSCGHGVARWDSGCECTEGDSSWKGGLRRALSALAERGDQLFERYAARTLSDPWAARNAYLDLRNGWMAPADFWSRFGTERRMPAQQVWVERTIQLLEAQYYQQCSFTSCGFFFEDLDRIEPRNDIAFARRAISLYWQATAIDLQRDFLAQLEQVKGWRTHLSGASLYRQLPREHEKLPSPAQG
jgi:hypothetical protein